jgi:hypothetical protein
MEGYTVPDYPWFTQDRLEQAEQRIKQLEKRVSELERAPQEWRVAGLDRVKGLIEPMAEEWRKPHHG